MAICLERPGSHRKGLFLHRAYVYRCLGSSSNVVAVGTGDVTPTVALGTGDVTNMPSAGDAKESTFTRLTAADMRLDADWRRILRPYLLWRRRWRSAPVAVGIGDVRQEELDARVGHRLVNAASPLL